MNRFWAFDLDHTRHEVELGGDSLWSDRPRFLFCDGNRITIHWRRVSPLLRWNSARWEFAFGIAGRPASLHRGISQPPWAKRLQTAGRASPRAFLTALFWSLVTGNTAAGTGIGGGVTAEAVRKLRRTEYRLVIGEWDLGPPQYALTRSPPPPDRRVPTVEEHLAGRLPRWAGARAWTPGLAASVRRVHELLAATLHPEPRRFVILYQFRMGGRDRTLVQLDPYDGRLYFPGKTLGEAGLRREDLQAKARAAGMRAGGTWIVLPETKPELDRLIEVLIEFLHTVAPIAMKRAVRTDK